MRDYTNAIIIGGGASGISMAYKLTRMGFRDFTIYDKMEGIGGTWYANTYPGCGCDVPSHLYSFSFALNPDWSKALCEQPEILAYLNNVVDKFGLRGFFELQVECLGAVWNEEERIWEVRLKNLVTGIEYTRTATIFVSAVGGISAPREVDLPGKDTFTGESWHSARWDHSYDYTGKRLAVVGNGCSASQIVPKVVQKASFVKQYSRSAQWYHERPNKSTSSLSKALCRYVPLYQRYLRFRLFSLFETMTLTYGDGEKAAKERLKVEASAIKYTLDKTPEKYHNFIIPDFPLGCKRRVFDPDYLDSLSSPNLDVTASKIKQIDGSVIETENGDRTEFDAICYATGFRVTEFLTPMKVVGRDGALLNEKWRAAGGAVAYKGTTVAGFPNFAILFGPNTFLAHNSAIFILEMAADYTIRNIFKPILDKQADSVEVKEEAQNFWATKIQYQLQKMVWSGGCSNWNLTSNGRNTASYPGTGMDLVSLLGAQQISEVAENHCQERMGPSSGVLDNLAPGGSPRRDKRRVAIIETGASELRIHC
ncbi:monooxygenase [Exophiala viscosa]|uniref:monooxygenase n=1 Tax=Exophiala viscosa TaxID=2486360 RepID=UPI00218CF831|nr:monooxygenase [Exophiala viscosa]